MVDNQLTVKMAGRIHSERYMAGLLRQREAEQSRRVRSGVYLPLLLEM